MIPFVPRDGSPGARILAALGTVLGLRSQTVYSRAILLLALFQFVVLGLAVVLVWIVVTDQFRRADERDLLAAAQRVGDYLASTGARPVQAALPSVAELTGRDVFWRAGAPAAAPGIVRIETRKDGGTDAVFSPLGGAEGDVVVAGRRSFYEAGLLAARTFVVGLALAGGLMLVIMLLVVDRTIVGRIQLLADKVEHEKDSERLPVTLDYPGDDELAMLARSIEELALLVQQAEREYRHVVEDQTESICRFDREGKITFCNKAFEVLCASAPRGKRASLASCLGSGLRISLEQVLSELGPEKPIARFTHAGPNGRWYRSVLRATFDPQGRSAGGQWIAGEVTSEVEAQRKLQDSQRQLAQLSARLMTLQDEERRRLARELHDSTAQSLAALEMNMSALSTAAMPAEIKRLSEESAAISRQVCDELRTISYLLHPPLLEEAGLVFALRWLADGFTKRNSIPVVVDVSDSFPRLSPELETALFRIVQESLSNIYRHAGATKAWISLSRDENGEISLEIRDNGEGLPDDFSLNRSSGVGLAGMRERVRELGGTLEIDSSDYGVAVKCRLRRHSAAEDAEYKHQGELFAG